jgi:hypothetical protein
MKLSTVQPLAAGGVIFRDLRAWCAFLLWSVVRKLLCSLAQRTCHPMTVQAWWNTQLKRQDTSHPKRRVLRAMVELGVHTDHASLPVGKVVGARQGNYVADQAARRGRASPAGNARVRGEESAGKVVMR